MGNKKRRARRANGEGALHERLDGRWEMKIVVGHDPVTGKPKRKSITGSKQSDVIAKAAALKAQLHNKTYVDDNNQTLEQWLKRWLEIYAKPKVKISTFESYESVARNHIIPTLGKIKLQDLHPHHIQDFYNKKLNSAGLRGQQKLSSTVVSYMHAVIHQALKQAVKEQLVIRNVADLVDKPRPRQHEIQPLSIDQIKIFIQAVKNHKFGLAYILECYTGLRRGELLGLRWQDIDFTHSTLSVRQSLIRTRAGLTFSTPKTKRSYRTIPLPADIIGDLKNLKEAQKHNQEVAGEEYAKHNLVFCNDFGHPIEPRNFVRRFELVLEKAGLPKVTFHDMRHSHATMLLSLNEHPKIVQERLGHSSISITLDTYSHVLPGLQERATEKISKVLDPEKSD